MKNLKIKVKRHLIKKGFIVFENKKDKFVNLIAIKNLTNKDGEKLLLPTVISSSSSNSSIIRYAPAFVMIGISLSKFNKRNEKKAIELLEKKLFSDFYFVKSENNKILFGHINHNNNNFNNITYV